MIGYSALHRRSITFNLLKAAPELGETMPQIGWIVIDTCKYDGPLDADEELVCQVGIRGRTAPRD